VRRTWRGSAAPDGEQPPRITGMGAVGARRAVPETVPDMGAQASRLRMETQASFCAEPSGKVAESMRRVDSAPERSVSRGM